MQALAEMVVANPVVATAIAGSLAMTLVQLAKRCRWFTLVPEDEGKWRTFAAAGVASLLLGLAQEYIRAHGLGIPVEWGRVGAYVLGTWLGAQTLRTAIKGATTPN